MALSRISLALALACLVAVAGNRAAALLGPGALLPAELEIALSGFLVAALATWRVALRASRAGEPSEPAPPSETPPSDPAPPDGSQSPSAPSEDSR